MGKYSVINLKTDPNLKILAAKTANKLGISVSAVLNNELRRFTTEQSVEFGGLEVPNAETAIKLSSSRQKIESGDYHKFDDNRRSIKFLADELK